MIKIIFPVLTISLSAHAICGTQMDSQGIETANQAAASIERSYEVLKVLTQPTSIIGSQLRYQMPEVRLQPGQALYFAVPSNLQERDLNFVVLGHRQDPNTHKGWNSQTQRDDLPGLLSFQVLNKNGEWRYWGGMASGKNGAKYAEPRHSLEMENLYEWEHQGNCSIAGGGCEHGPVQPQVIRVVSVGSDEVLVGEVMVKFTPPQPSEYLEQIFTPGTSFHEKVGGKAHFGGGQKSQGKFPKALALYGIHAIELPSGKKLVSIEIAGGDSHPDGIINSDGGWGTQGWSQLSIGKGTSECNASWFLKGENVPPEGLMMATPGDCESDIHVGEKLYIRGSSDTLYIMGIRLGFN